MIENDTSKFKLLRGLFRTKEGITLNSDVNGAYNILRKASLDNEALQKFPPKDGIEGLELVPIAVKVAELNQFSFSELETLNPKDKHSQKSYTADGIEAVEFSHLTE